MPRSSILTLLNDAEIAKGASTRKSCANKLSSRKQAVLAGECIRLYKLYFGIKPALSRETRTDYKIPVLSLPPKGMREFRIKHANILRLKSGGAAEAALSDIQFCQRLSAKCKSGRPISVLSRDLFVLHLAKKLQLYKLKNYSEILPAIIGVFSGVSSELFGFSDKTDNPPGWDKYLMLRKDYSKRLRNYKLPKKNRQTQKDKRLPKNKQVKRRIKNLVREPVFPPAIQRELKYLLSNKL